MQWTGNIVYSWERELLTAMDLAFCAKMGEELADYHERMKETSKPKGK